MWSPGLTGEKKEEKNKQTTIERKINKAVHKVRIKVLVSESHRQLPISASLSAHILILCHFGHGPSFGEEFSPLFRSNTRSKVRRGSLTTEIGIPKRNTWKDGGVFPKENKP